MCEWLVPAATGAATTDAQRGVVMDAFAEIEATVRPSSRKGYHRFQEAMRVAEDRAQARSRLLIDDTLRVQVAEGEAATTRIAQAVAEVRAEAVSRIRELSEERLLDRAEAVLESCSYERVLERGFALVWDDAERPVWSMERLVPRMALTVRFHDGAAGVTVNEDTGKGAGGPGAGGGGRRAPKTQRGKPRRKPSPDDRQGTLL